jgi:alkaline phosphatase D
VHNASPFAGFQFFGEVNIDGQTGELNVVLRDLDGVSVFEQKLSPRDSAVAHYVGNGFCTKG